MCANLRWAISEYAPKRARADATGTVGDMLRREETHEKRTFDRLIRLESYDHWRYVVIPKIQELRAALGDQCDFATDVIEHYRHIHRVDELGKGQAIAIRQRGARAGRRSVLARTLSGGCESMGCSRPAAEWRLHHDPTVAAGYALCKQHAAIYDAPSEDDFYEELDELYQKLEHWLTIFSYGDDGWSEQQLVDMMTELHGGWSEPHAQVMDWLQTQAVERWYRDQGIPQTVRDAASVRVITGVLGDWRIVGRDLVNDIQTATLRLTHCNDDTGDLDEPCVVDSCYRTYGHAHLDCRACDLSTTLAYHVARFTGAYQAWNKRHTHV